MRKRIVLYKDLLEKISISYLLQGNTYRMRDYDLLTMFQLFAEKRWTKRRRRRRQNHFVVNDFIKLVVDFRF